jgi:uncharacterized membrane protein
VKVVHLISMFLFSLVAGVFWGTWFSVSRSIGSITPQTFLEIGHTMIGNLGGSMPFLMPASLVSIVVLMILLYRRHRRQALWLATVALLLLVAALVVTLTINVPIDDRIASWTVEALPSDWQAIRDRWEFYHGLRTFFSLVGLACLLASALWSSPQPRAVS